MKLKTCSHCGKETDESPRCPQCEESWWEKEKAITRHGRRKNLYTVQGWPPELGAVQQPQLELPLFGPKNEPPTKEGVQ